MARLEQNAYEKLVEEVSKSTDSKKLAHYSYHTNTTIRGKVASNLFTSKKILNRLASDGDIYVREQVARNPNASVKTLKLLSQDSVSDIRAWVAENPYTPASILNTLSKDTRWLVVSNVCENENVGLNSLLYVISNEMESLVAFAAANPKVPYKYVKHLRLDSSEEFQTSLERFFTGEAAELYQQLCIDQIFKGTLEDFVKLSNIVLE